MAGQPQRSDWKSEAEEVAELASAIAPAAESHGGVFEQALGVGPDCLSAENLVQALYEGVVHSNASHLTTCRTCAENMAAFTFTLAGQGRDVVGAALGNIEKETKPALPLSSQVVPAIVAMENNLIRVPRQGAIGFACEIIPLGVESLSSIDPGSIRATGALLSSAEPSIELLDHNQDGKPDSIRLEFPGLNVGSRIAGALENDQSVSDTVQITGTLCDARSKYRFAGQMQVEFEKI